MRLSGSRANQLLQQLYERGCTLAKLALLALILYAPSCGAPAPATADAVHQAWIQAIRAGDAATAQQLADPTLPDPAAFAQDAVSRMREYLTSPASPTGALQDVTVEAVVDGVGRSVWQFANKRWCYRAELVSQNNRWYISRWGQTSVACP
jgi:hypothetical protein